MIAVCEPQCNGYAHESHNAGMLLALTKAYPNEQVTFFAEKTHIEAICYCFSSAGLDTSQITFVPVELPKVSASFWSFYRDFCFIKSILEKAEWAGAKSVFFLSLHANSLLALKFLQILKHGDINFYVLLHGVMEYARHPFYWCVLKPRQIRWIQHFKYILRYPKIDAIRYIALSPFCCRQIKKDAFFSNIQVDSMYLPIALNFNANILEGKKITFATVGGGNPQRVAALDSLLAQKGYFDYQILVFGDFPSKYKHSCQLVPLKKNDPLSREKISQVMHQVDILLFLYDVDSYQYTQSGAFYEIFQYNKPAIFLKNENFKWHNSINGPVAQEVDSLSAMAQEIGLLLKADPLTVGKYLQYRENIAKVRSRMDLFNNAYLKHLELA